MKKERELNAQKPIGYIADFLGPFPFYECPSCDGHVDFGDKSCKNKNCKQALDWKNVEGYNEKEEK